MHEFTPEPLVENVRDWMTLTMELNGDHAAPAPIQELFETLPVSNGLVRNLTSRRSGNGHQGVEKRAFVAAISVKKQGIINSASNAHGRSMYFRRVVSSRSLICWRTRP